MDFDLEEYDLELIGDPIQYTEEIERPEATRFFTLDDQIQDYVNKRMPRHDISEHALKRLQRESDRIRLAYKTYIQLLDNNYSLKGKRRHKPSWVHPLIEKPNYNAYDIMTKWKPLFDKARSNQPNYYTDIIKSLPKPYEPGENVRVMNENIIGFSEERISYLNSEDSRFLHTGEYRGLVDYVLTTTSKNDDGTFSVVEKSVSGTGDSLQIRGFLKDTLPAEIPRPMPGVPFLDSSKPGILITTDELDRIYPSIELIVSHAIAKTDNPYKDALPYLKLWDVNLSEIPWSVWKIQFPQTHRLGESPAIKSISFPDRKNQLPRIGVQSFFTLLMNMQVKSLAISPINPSEMQLPDSTPDQCLRTDTYEHFLSSGVYREIQDKDGTIHKKCVPVEIIQKEISERYTKNKRPWNDLVKNDILKSARETSELLEDTKTNIISQPEFDNIPIKDSETRKRIMLVLKDDERTDKDKANELMNKLLANIAPESDERKIYLDTDGSFLLCAHSLSILNGDYKTNPQEFQREWATIIEGKYTCNHCGEKIGNNFVAVTDYDEDGHAVTQSSALPKSKGRIMTLKTDLHSLPELQSKFVQMFPKKSAVIQLLFIILTTLQILPTEDQLKEVLDVTFTLYNKIQGKISDASIAIASAVLIVQSNSLSARRAYKSKPVNLNGYPRDTGDINDSPIIMNFIDILKDIGKVGGIESHVKIALSKVKDEEKIKKELTPTLSTLLKGNKKVAERIQTGRDVQAIEGVQATIVFPSEPVAKISYKPSDLVEKVSVKTICNVVRPSLILKAQKGPILSASPSKLRKIEVLETSKILETTLSERRRVVIYTESDIRRLSKTKCPASFENSIINRFIRDEKDYVKLSNLLTSLIENTSSDSRKFGKEILENLRIANIQKTFESTLLKIFFYQFFNNINDAQKTEILLPQLEETFKRDIVSVVLRKDPISAIADEESLRAVERLNLVQRLRGMDDEQREVMGRLLQMGLEPGIITNEDRRQFANEAQTRQTTYDRHRGELLGGDDEPNIDHEDGMPDLLDGGRYGGYGEMQRADGEETDFAGRNGMLAGGEF